MLMSGIVEICYRTRVDYIYIKQHIQEMGGEEEDKAKEGNVVKHVIDKSKPIYARSPKGAFILLMVVNIAAFTHHLPVWFQLFFNSCACVYAGCILSTKLYRDTNTNELVTQKEIGEDSEVLGMKEAMKFPVMASIFLFGFYIAYKYLPKDILNTLIRIQFSIGALVSTIALLHPLIKYPASFLQPTKEITPHRYLKSLFDLTTFTLSPATFTTFLICLIPIVMYFCTNNWFLNNIYGVLFTILALGSINLSSFKVGFLMLWLLFFYDIFWVYGTDVMVTVAKSLDIPIKLMFPYLKEGEVKHSMLGLGDIVIPGIFLAIALKFDIDNAIHAEKQKGVQQERQQKKQQSASVRPWIELPYFNASFLGYFIGILATFTAMYVFDHPQPALLFLVPGCTGMVAGLAAYRGEIQKVYNYESGMKKEQPKAQAKAQSKAQAKSDEKKAQVKSEQKKQQ